MIISMMLAVFAVALVLGLQIAVAVAGSAIVPNIIDSSFPANASYIIRSMIAGVDSFTILALPLFMLSGDIMCKGGVSKKLFDLFALISGKRSAGMPIATVITCLFFGAISGSGPATGAALGIILIPAMINRGGFSAPFASALMAAASSIAIVIPPSISFVVYASITGVGVGDMFVGGILPGIMMGLALVVVIMIEVHNKGLTATREKASWGQRWASFREAFWGFLVPVIILGGIYSGIFTATEAAVVASVYGIVIGLFVHRELKLEKLWAIFRDNAAFIAGTMFVMAPSKATGQVFAYLNITKIIANFMFSISTNPYIVLCMIFVIMFIVGMFVQTTPAIVILAPTLLAVVSQVGIDPIHFGIIMTLALAIAFVTPPVALNLFVGSSMTGLSIDKIVRAFMPFLIGLIVAFFIVSFVPAISLGVLGDWSLTFG